MAEESMIEQAARAVERSRRALYDWTDDQFEEWFNHDPRFISSVTCYVGGFVGTRKEHLLREVRLMIERLREPNGAMIDRARVMLEERKPCANITPELIWETMIDAILEEVAE